MFALPLCCDVNIIGYADICAIIYRNCDNVKCHALRKIAFPSEGGKELNFMVAVCDEDVGHIAACREKSAILLAEFYELFEE